MKHRSFWFHLPPQTTTTSKRFAMMILSVVVTQQVRCQSIIVRLAAPQWSKRAHPPSVSFSLPAAALNKNIWAHAQQPCVEIIARKDDIRIRRETRGHRVNGRLMIHVRKAKLLPRFILWLELCIKICGGKNSFSVWNQSNVNNCQIYVYTPSPLSAVIPYLNMMSKYKPFSKKFLFEQEDSEFYIVERGCDKDAQSNADAHCNTDTE